MIYPGDNTVEDVREHEAWLEFLRQRGVRAEGGRERGPVTQAQLDAEKAKIATLRIEFEDRQKVA